MSDMHTSSILRSSLTSFGDRDRHSFEDLLRFDEEEVLRLIERARPFAKVIFTRLEPKVKVYADEKMFNTAASSSEQAEVTIAERFIYDLRPLGRAMCLGVGRYEFNDFRPFLSSKTDRMDMFVSREHGIIFIDDTNAIAYRDVGTFRSGSTNGTRINDGHAIRNELIRWAPGDYLGYGDLYGGAISKFKARYELMPAVSPATPSS